MWTYQKICRLLPGKTHSMLAWLWIWQAIRCGSFTSVKDLIAAIENFIDG